MEDLGLGEKVSQHSANENAPKHECNEVAHSQSLQQLLWQKSATLTGFFVDSPRLAGEHAVDIGPWQQGVRPHACTMILFG